MTFDAPMPDEMALVYDAWIRSFRKSPWAGCVRNDRWEDVQRATIDGLLDRGARVLVALAPQVPGVFEGRRVMGFSVSEPGALHYWYVKADFRHKGIGRALLARTTEGWPPPAPCLPWTYSHRTRASALLPRHWRWDPTSARVKER